MKVELTNLQAYWICFFLLLGGSLLITLGRFLERKKIQKQNEIKPIPSSFSDDDKNYLKEHIHADFLKSEFGTRLNGHSLREQKEVVDLFLCHAAENLNAAKLEIEQIEKLRGKNVTVELIMIKGTIQNIINTRKSIDEL